MAFREVNEGGLRSTSQRLWWWDSRWRSPASSASDRLPKCPRRSWAVSVHRAVHNMVVGSSAAGISPMMISAPIEEASFASPVSPAENVKSSSGVMLQYHRSSCQVSDAVSTLGIASQTNESTDRKRPAVHVTQSQVVRPRGGPTVRPGQECPGPSDGRARPWLMAEIVGPAETSDLSRGDCSAITPRAFIPGYEAEGRTAEWTRWYTDCRDVAPCIDRSHP